MSLYRSEEMGSIVQLTYEIPTRLHKYAIQEGDTKNPVSIILHTRLYKLVTVIERGCNPL